MKKLYKIFKMWSLIEKSFLHRYDYLLFWVLFLLFLIKNIILIALFNIWLVNEFESDY
jgi:hypothetical protein